MEKQGENMMIIKSLPCSQKRHRSDFLLQMSNKQDHICNNGKIFKTAIDSTNRAALCFLLQEVL